MAAKFKPGDTAWIVESNRFIREVEVRSCAAGMCLIKFKNSGGGIRVRENRLFATREAAEGSVVGGQKKEPRRRTPYDYE